MPGRRTPPMPERLVAAMREQRVHQRAVGIAGRGMNHEPGRLVDDDDMLVLIDDGEIHGLRHRLVGDRRRQAQGEALAGADPQRRVRYGRAIQGHVSRLDEMLDARPRKIGEMRRQQPVETRARLGGLCRNLPQHLGRLVEGGGIGDHRA